MFRATSQFAQLSRLTPACHTNTLCQSLWSQLNCTHIENKASFVCRALWSCSGSGLDKRLCTESDVGTKRIISANIMSPWSQSENQRGMSGHSKWANIKHTKEAKDAKKHRQSMTFVQRIKVAVRGKNDNCR